MAEMRANGGDESAGAEGDGAGRERGGSDLEKRGEHAAAGAGGSAGARDSAKGGRPAVLDETKQAEICAMVAAGCSFRAAANYVGCAVSTILRLKNMDATFRARLCKALGEREAFLVARMNAAGERSWRPTAWMLERTVGGHYRPGSGVNPIDLEQAAEEELLANVRGMVSGGGAACDAGAALGVGAGLGIPPLPKGLPADLSAELPADMRAELSAEEEAKAMARIAKQLEDRDEVAELKKRRLWR